MSDAAAVFQNPLWARVGWALAAFLWQGAVVGLLLAGANAILRGARARYAAACAALLVMLACPVATFLDRGSDFTAPTASAASATASRPAGPIAAPAIRAAAPSRASVFVTALKARTANLAPRLAPYWAAGVLLLSLRFLGGWAVARRLTRRNVAPVPAAVRDALARLSKRLELRRAVSVLQSAAVSVPTALGTLRPVVLLPLSALTGLTAEALDAVLAHELAHIRRRDYLVNLLQTAVETLLFYHPAVWWVSRRIRIERENCCDDIAVEATGDVRAYARALVGLEEIRDRGPRLAVAANGGTLFQRIARLLPSPSPADRASRWVAAVLAVLAIGTLGAAARVTPPVVASELIPGGVEVEPIPAIAGERIKTGSVPPKVAGVRGGTPGGVKDGVVANVAGGIPGNVRPAIAGQTATPVPDPSPESRVPSPDPGRPLSPDELIELKHHGVTAEFLGALASLGYKQASLDDLLAVKIHGVTPEFISAMNGLFNRQLSLDELTSLRIHGVSPEFVKAFRDAGYADISADSAQSLRIHGATPEMAAEWAKLLGRRPSLDEVVSARIHGATPDYGREMKSLGVEPDLDSLVSMRIHGVTPDFLRAMHGLGYPRISADDAVSLKIHGVTPEYAREVQSLGYKTITLDDLTSFRIHGVTPDFIRDANRSAKPPLSVDELLDARIHRRR
jgi:beta-lactamase regulating signal transducer with metallopeptidase domain